MDHTGPSCFASPCRTWCFHPRGVVQAPAPADTEPRCVTVPIGMGTGTGDTAGRSRAAPPPCSAPVQGKAPPGMFLSLWSCLDTSCSLVTLDLRLSNCWEQRDAPGSPLPAPARPSTAAQPPSPSCRGPGKAAVPSLECVISTPCAPQLWQRGGSQLPPGGLHTELFQLCLSWPDVELEECGGSAARC